MNLKLVTWDADLTQFLVDAKDDIEAIQIAVMANRDFEKDNNFDHDSDVDNLSLYDVLNVDIELLMEIIMQRECYGRLYGNGKSIVFSDC